MSVAELAVGGVAERHAQPCASGGTNRAWREHGERAERVIFMPSEAERGRTQAHIAATRRTTRVCSAQRTDRGELDGVHPRKPEAFDPLRC